MANQTFTAVLHKEEDLYVAECPEVGTVSQGSTTEEAQRSDRALFRRVSFRESYSSLVDHF